MLSGRPARPACERVSVRARPLGRPATPSAPRPRANARPGREARGRGRTLVMGVGVASRALGVRTVLAGCWVGGQCNLWLWPHAPLARARRPKKWRLLSPRTVRVAPSDPTQTNPHQQLRLQLKQELLDPLQQPGRHDPLAPLVAAMPKISPPAIPLSGLIAFHKPSGPTSNAVLDSLKHLFADSPLFAEPSGASSGGGGGGGGGKGGKKSKGKGGAPQGVKMGQGGTLDPLADGILGAYPLPLWSLVHPRARTTCSADLRAIPSCCSQSSASTAGPSSSRASSAAQRCGP